MCKRVIYFWSKHLRLLLNDLKKEVGKGNQKQLDTRRECIKWIQFMCCTISLSSNVSVGLGRDAHNCESERVSPFYWFQLTHKPNQTKTISHMQMFTKKHKTPSFYSLKSFRRAIPLQRIKYFTIAFELLRLRLRFQNWNVFRCDGEWVSLSLACLFNTIEAKQKHTYNIDHSLTLGMSNWFFPFYK